MRTYTRLTLKERYYIYLWHASPKSIHSFCFYVDKW